jgi:hypothetical protein
MIWSAVHFMAAFLTGVIANGVDFDQLRSRSALATVAGYAHDFLMGPHGAVIRAMPNAWLTQSRVALVPLWLALHSLAWGIAIAMIVELWARHRPRSKR